MLTKLLTTLSCFLFLAMMFLSGMLMEVVAQDTIRVQPPDTLILTDSISVPADSGALTGKKEPPLSSKVEYVCEDSLRFEIKNQKLFLYHQAKINYEKIELKADFVDIDFPQNVIHAEGVPDSAGVEQGLPEFTEGDNTFKSRIMTYNYKTKKGYIQKVYTKQDEGYLHGQVVKKMADDITYIQNGTYTTCDLQDHPHFGFRFSKAKVIPNSKVVTGPAYMEIAGVPTPLFIPFGFFPNRSGQRSGILFPTYGESNNRGFFLENGGYYWAINDRMDLEIKGDIYSRGSWAIKPTFRYVKRYKYNGYLNLSYADNRLGIPGTPSFEKSKDFRIRWQHSQDHKARPNSNFSANVNIVSNNFNKYNPSSSTQAYLSNTFNSSVNYSTSFAGKYYLNLNFSHSQNTLDKSINLTLPQISFSVNQFYPFRRKVSVGKLKWYENISMKYNLDAENRYNTYDSLLFQPGWFRQMKNGIRHSYPISGTWRILKYLNFTNNISITDRMYFSSIRKQYIDDPVYGADSGFYKTDTIYGFKNALDFSFSTSLNTRLYGMFLFKKGPIIAIRHMLTPSVSFTYTPDFGSPFWGYWKPIDNDTATVNPQRYSVFENAIYGGPPQQQAGVVNFNLTNNLEMKIRNRKDTITGVKKITLIDNFVISTSYDIAKDSLNWSPIRMSGRTTLFKNLNINYNSTWDMYARVDSTNTRLNVSEWKMNRRLLRLDNSGWDIGLNYSLSSDKVNKKKETTKGTPQEREDIAEFYDYYVDFDIPWSFTINYNFNYKKNWSPSQKRRVDEIVQTLGFSGQLNITPKWKITLITGWDFTHNQLAYTSVDIYRDLHCWEMRFGWVPKGAQQQWNFSINVKASVLQDMKLNKKKDFRDFRD